MICCWNMHKSMCLLCNWSLRFVLHIKSSSGRSNRSFCCAFIMEFISQIGSHSSWNFRRHENFFCWIYDNYLLIGTLCCYGNHFQKFHYHIGFVCLFTCSVRRHTWVLMGPDSYKMLKPGVKSLWGLLYMLALWSMEIIDRNRLKGKVKEEKDHVVTRNKSSWTILLWVKRREKLIQSQLPLRLVVIVVVVVFFVFGGHFLVGLFICSISSFIWVNYWWFISKSLIFF